MSQGIIFTKHYTLDDVLLAIPLMKIKRQIMKSDLMFGQDIYDNKSNSNTCLLYFFLATDQVNIKPLLIIKDVEKK